MLGGILPFRPRFADEWGMSLSSPIKKQTHIFLKSKSLIFGKWHLRGSAVGFTGRGSRAQPPGSPWPSPSRLSARPALDRSLVLPGPCCPLQDSGGGAAPQARSRAALPRSCCRHSLGRSVCGLQPSWPQAHPQAALTFPLLVTV